MCEFENTETSLSRHDIIKQKLREHFDGKIVRKDLTKKMKEGANQFRYMYWNSSWGSIAALTMKKLSRRV